MENRNRRLPGRPLMESGKRIKKIEARFTEEEFNAVVELEKSLGISRTELIRMRILKDSGLLVVNAVGLLNRLDTVGADLGRIGNNINQLARYANILDKRGLLSPQIIERFNVLIDAHVDVQQKLEIALRKIIRSMGH